MLNKLTTFFDHSRHKLSVSELDAPYRIETNDGRVFHGVTDENGDTQVHYGLEPQNSELFFE